MTDDRSFHQSPERRQPTRSHAAVWEAVVIAADSIWSHKLRSVLTLLGIIIGVASVVAVGGAIEGLGSYVNERLVSTFGSNTFIVARIARINMSQEEWEKVLKRNRRLQVADLRAIEEGCEGCDSVSPTVRWTDDAKAGNQIFYDAEVLGVSTQLPSIEDIQIEEGRFLSGMEIDRARPVAVIGSAVRTEIFGGSDALGKEFKLGGEKFTIVGIEASKGSFFGQSLDNRIYIPYTAFLKKYGTRQSISLRVKAPDEKSLESTQDEVRVILRSRHKLRPNQEDDFDILGSQAIRQSVGQFTGAIAAVVTPITLISLIVGGIVVMNIMLVTVTERTNEIGLRKSIGARRRDILLQFLIESALLATAGGALGLLLAYAVSIVVVESTPVPMTITPGYVALALLASGGIGIISGLYPAHKASKLNPIVALSRD